jgi:hypothetical protein
MKDSFIIVQLRACNRSPGKTWQGKPLETPSLTKIHIFLVTLDTICLLLNVCSINSEIMKDSFIIVQLHGIYRFL